MLLIILYADKHTYITAPSATHVIINHDVDISSPYCHFPSNPETYLNVKIALRSMLIWKITCNIQYIFLFGRVSKLHISPFNAQGANNIYGTEYGSVSQSLPTDVCPKPAKMSKRFCQWNLSVNVNLVLNTALRIGYTDKTMITYDTGLDKLWIQIKDRYSLKSFESFGASNHKIIPPRKCIRKCYRQNGMVVILFMPQCATNHNENTRNRSSISRTLIYTVKVSAMPKWLHCQRKGDDPCQGTSGLMFSGLLFVTALINIVTCVWNRFGWVSPPLLMDGCGGHDVMMTSYGWVSAKKT